MTKNLHKILKLLTIEQVPDGMAFNEDDRGNFK